MYFSKFTMQKNDKNAIKYFETMGCEWWILHISLNNVLKMDSQRLTLAPKLFDDAERRNVC